MKQTRYANHQIHCGCGTSFYTELETDLESELTSNSFDDEVEDSASYNCPGCKSVIKLTIELKKEVTLEHAIIEVIGKTVTGHDGRIINVEALNDFSIGDQATIKGDEDKAELHFLDGTYEASERQFIVENGILSAIWGLPDENQISLFEESLVA